MLRDGTEPAFVGDVDEVEVAVRGAADSLPQDIRLVVIEPGEADAEPTVATTSLVEEPDAAPPAIVDESAPGGTSSEPDGFAAAAVSRPTINTRAQWGADESIMTWTPQVGRVNGAVVHHTAGSNNYTAAQVPSIIRGIYTYHAQSAAGATSATTSSSTSSVASGKDARAGWSERSWAHTRQA